MAEQTENQEALTGAWMVRECVKAVLEKYADPVLDKIATLGKNVWAGTKVDFDIPFLRYEERAYEKYSRIKTILYRAEPQPLYDFFEYPKLRMEQRIIRTESVENILNISRFLLIEGTGGIGKSTLLKHLFMNELAHKDLIPIYLELKDMNEADASQTIREFIFERLNTLGSKLDEAAFEYALKQGYFLFLMDGYDEVTTEKRNRFFRDIDTFFDRYPENYYVISSRPISSFLELQRFTVLETLPFDKEQAVSLIEKLDFDREIKQRFVTALSDRLFDEHESFASNPLLLSIMLLTYDNYAEIPAKQHLFYEEAFHTLYSKHDATKSGYKRTLRSGLSYDDFRSVFAYFCFASYLKDKLEFSREACADLLKEAQKHTKLTFDWEDYLEDLLTSVCVLYQDGLAYLFSHRSFQEYFTALFLKDLPDDRLFSTICLQMIRRDYVKCLHDNVCSMLFDMAQDRFERGILLPLLDEIEANNFSTDLCKSHYYAYSVELILGPFSRGIGLGYALSGNEDNSYYNFIFSFVHHTSLINNAWSSISGNSQDYILHSINWLLHNSKDISPASSSFGFTLKDVADNPQIYELFKETWIGQYISYLSHLRADIEARQKQSADDLLKLLDT